MLSKKLESELICGFCQRFFNTPRILDCGHSVCEECGKQNLHKVNVPQPKFYQTSNSNSSLSTFQRQRDQTSFAGSHDSEQDTASESDSGIFLSNTSHGSMGSVNTFTATMNQPGSTIRLSNKHHIQIICSNCGFPSILSQQYSTIDYFPLNLTLASICTKYQIENNSKLNSEPSSSQLCQLCDDSNKDTIQPATLFCEQCEVFYCLHCREKYHPMRGPFEKHNLLLVTDIDTTLKRKIINCSQHSDETLEYFCDQCNRLICRQCMTVEHSRHLTSSISTHSKKAKVSLSKSLQRISERVKTTTEFLQSLKSTTDQLKAKHDNFVENIDLKINYLIDVLESKRKSLHEQAKFELENKEKIIKDQINDGGIFISQTMSMMNLAVELIKETNGAQFSMIADQMETRIERVENKFNQEFSDLKPKCRKRFEFCLETDSLMKEINNLQFKEFKSPECPKFIFERCSVWDNLINVVWYPQGSIEVDKYLLEIDDGCGGQFKTAYCGPESMCTIENLNFSSCYRLRIRAINEAGVSRKGDIIKLNTSTIAKFRMLPVFGPKKLGINLSNDGLVIESVGSKSEDNNSKSIENKLPEKQRIREHTVLLANTGFIKGIHYWEYRIEYFDDEAEFSFGVAMENCVKNKILGSDIFSWGMFIDRTRSWFIANSQYLVRKDIEKKTLFVGDRIGVCLDLNEQRLSYYFNGKPYRSIPFSKFLVRSSKSYSQLINSSQSGSGSNHSLNENNSRMKMLYPAVSFNHNIKLSLISGLSPPSDDNKSEEEDNKYVENMTPLMSKKIDISHLLEDGVSSNDNSFRELIL